MKNKLFIDERIFLIFLLSSFLIFSFVSGNQLVAGEYRPGQHSITITHYWNNDTVADRPNSIDLDVYQSVDENIEDEDALVSQVTLRAEDNWTVTVPNLAEDYYYYAKLVTPIPGYTTLNDQVIEMVIPADQDGLLWRDPDFYNHLGTANYFSAFVFNDYSVASADVESGLAAGGNLRSLADFSLGLPASKDAQWGWFSPDYNVGLPVMPHNPRLIVGGVVEIPMGLHVIGGNLVMKDNTKITSNTQFIKEWYYQGTGVYDSSHPQSEFSSIMYTPHTGDSFENYSDVKTVDATKFDNFFAEGEASLKNLSQKYGALVNDNSSLVMDITPDAMGAILLEPQLPAGVSDYSGYEYLVYNVKVAHTNTYWPQPNMPAGEGGIWKANIVMPPEFKGMVIVNVLSDNINTLHLEDGTIQINGLDYIPGTQETNVEGRFFEMACSYSDQIVWNFPDSSMSTLKMKAYGIIGSFLSPYSDLMASGGNINGTVVANSVSANTGFEVHSTTFRGRGELGHDLPLFLSSTKDSNHERSVAKASLKGEKITVGKQLTAGQFEFAVKEGENVVAKGSNDENGKITFNDIFYSEVGHHHYTVVETSEDDGDWKMDRTVYAVDVIIDTDEVDDFVVTVEKSSEKMVFTNVYTDPKNPKKHDPSKPEKPNNPSNIGTVNKENALPRTGSASMLLGYSVVLLGILCMAFSGFKIYKKGINKKR